MPGLKLRCKKCGDVVQSMHTHDFRWCKCQSVAIDGGSDYTRVVGEPGDWEILEEQNSEEGLGNSCFGFRVSG